MKSDKSFAKAALLSTISVATICAATTAHAQNAARDGAAADDGVIVVTATKREQTLKETPVSVSVASGQTIEQAGIRDLIDLQSVAPSLRVTQLQSSANTNFVIRGFGNGANNAGIEPSVGVFIDGVYRSRSAAQIGDLPNVQRVEVLRGPQSTLFGKNASAGVISVVTREPQFQFGGSAELSYGNFNSIVAKADVTGPISDTIAASLSGSFNKADGYVDDLALGEETNDRDRYGVRGQILFAPTDALKLRLIGDYSKIDENCCFAGNIRNGPAGNLDGAPPNSALLSLLIGGATPFAAEDPFAYEAYTNFQSSNDIENWGFSGQLDYDLGNYGLTSITSYRGVDLITDQDSDFSAADLLGENSADTSIRTFTQELRLASDFDGPFNFLIGGFYFKEDIEQSNRLLFGSDFRPYGNQLALAASGGALNVAAFEATFGGLDFQAGNVASPAAYNGAFFREGDGFRENYTLDNEAWSIFGTLDFEVTDRLTLTAGFNYTRDRKEFTANADSNDVFSGIDFTDPQYAPFREQLLLGGGVPAPVANFLANNPTVTSLPFAFGPFPAGTPLSATPIGNANPLINFTAFQFLPPFVNVPNAVEDGKTRDNDLSYTLRAAYDLTDTVSVYASYATGFKASSINLSRDSRPTQASIDAGGFNSANLVAGTRLAGPEEAEVYELGLKARWDQVAVNIAVFDQTLNGFQSNLFNGTGFGLVNAGKQSVRGIEIDGSVSPIDALRLTAALTYLDASYDDFVGTGISVPGEIAFNRGGPQLDLTGARPSAIPEIAFQASATYTADMGSGNNLILRGDYTYESEVQIVDNLPGFNRDVNQLNGAITFAMENGLEVGVWGRNLLEDKYLLQVFPSVAQTGSVSGYPNKPRTYGAVVRFKF